MPRKSRRARRANIAELSPRHIADLLSGYWHRTTEGPDTLWESPEQRRQAWLKNRETIMQMSLGRKGPKGFFVDKGKGPGFRPLAWWDYEAPEPRQDGEEEADYLRRHNLLSPEEIEYLKQHENEYQ